MAPKTFPKEALSIEGGCNCEAIRYKVDVPAFNERMMNPYHNEGVDVGDLRIPMSAVCHCNDCRSATSGILSVVLVTDVKTVQVSLVRAKEVNSSEFKISTTVNRDFVPAKDVFVTGSIALDGQSFLACYKSSPGRNRFFCRRCGTPFAYSIDDERGFACESKKV